MTRSEDFVFSILEASQDGILIEQDETIIYVNKSYLNLFGFDDRRELIGQNVSFIIATVDQDRVLGYGRSRSNNAYAPAKYEFKGLKKEGTSIDVEASVSTLASEDCLYVITFIRDVGGRKRMEALLKAQKQALEMVVSGAPLKEVLRYLARIVERQSGGSSIASILFLDEEGRLRNGASPSLPESYLNAIDGLEAHVDIGTCSAAAAAGETIITPDIAADPTWAGIAHLPLGIGFKAAFSVPIISKDGLVLGTFGTYFRAPRRPSDLELQVVEILASTAAIAIERNTADEMLGRAKLELETRVKERTQELQNANAERVRILQQLITSQEDERRRIALDLHDQLGQQMTALRLSLESIKKKCDPAEELFRRVEETRKLVKQIDAEIDFLAWQFRPAVLDDIGIVAALEQLAKQWSEHFGIAVGIDGKRLGKSRLSPETETNYYRIAQEALNNISKHANAMRVNIILERRNGGTVLIIEDNGIGFDPEAVHKKEKGLGLLGMRERTSLLNGNLEIESSIGEGTTIYVTVPR